MKKTDVEIKHPLPWGVHFTIAVILNIIAFALDDIVAYVLFGIPAGIFYIYFVKSLFIEVQVKALELFNGQERAIKNRS